MGWFEALSRWLGGAPQPVDDAVPAAPVATPVVNDAHLAHIESALAEVCASRSLHWERSHYPLVAGHGLCWTLEFDDNARSFYTQYDVELSADHQHLFFFYGNTDAGAMSIGTILRRCVQIPLSDPRVLAWFPLTEMLAYLLDQPDRFPPNQYGLT